MNNNAFKKAIILLGTLFGGIIVCIIASIVIITTAQEGKQTPYIVALWVVFFISYIVYLTIYFIKATRANKQIEVDYKNGVMSKKEYADNDNSKNKVIVLSKIIFTVIIILIALGQLFHF